MAGLAKLCSAMLRKTKTSVQEIANRVATARRTAWAVHLADGGGAAVSLSRRLDTVGSRMARNGQRHRRISRTLCWIIDQGEAINKPTDRRECACTHCRCRIGIRGGLVRDIAVYLDPRHELCPKVGDEHLQAAV